MEEKGGRYGMFKGLIEKFESAKKTGKSGRSGLFKEFQIEEVTEAKPAENEDKERTIKKKNKSDLLQNKIVRLEEQLS